MKIQDAISIRKLHKLKHGLDSLDLKIKQLGVDLHSVLDMNRGVGQPFVLNEEAKVMKPMSSNLTYLQDLMSMNKKIMMVMMMTCQRCL